MKNSTKFLWVFSAGLILAGVPTAFAVSYKSDCKDLKAQNIELSTTVDKTTAELTEKDNLIKDYEDTLESVSNNIYYLAQYYIGETLNSSELVKKGEYPASIPQSSTSYLIHSWKLEDGTEVDPATYEFKTDTKFYANYEQKYLVSLYVQYPYGSLTNIPGNYYTASEFDFAALGQSSFNSSSFKKNYAGWTCVGWYIKANPDTIYKLDDTYELTENVTFYAVLNKEITATFKVDEETVLTQSHILSTLTSEAMYAHFDSSAITTPSKNGYIFKGWAVEGAEDTIIDSTFTFKDNTSFVAVFEEGYDGVTEPDFGDF